MDQSHQLNNSIFGGFTFEICDSDSGTCCKDANDDSGRYDAQEDAPAQATVAFLLVPFVDGQIEFLAPETEIIYDGSGNVRFVSL